MPGYDFVCRGCGASIELRLSMSAYAAGEGRECPRCGSSELERAFTAVNVIAGGGSDSVGRAGCGDGSRGFT